MLLGNIVCVSKARLGDFVAKLEPNEMKAVDEAIAISIDIKRHYDKLNNIHNDKLKYIKKLKLKINELKEEISTKDNELRGLNELREELKLDSIKELEEYVRESLLKKSMDK